MNSTLYDAHGQEFDPMKINNHGQPATLKGALQTSMDVAVGEIYIDADTLSRSTTGAVGTIGGVPVVGMVAGEESFTPAIPLPQDFDVEKPAYVTVVWSAVDGTITQSTTWVVLYDVAIPESGTIVAPATALDTVIAADAENDTADTLQITAEGIINANTFTKDDFVAFSVECDVEESANDPAANLIGLRIAYLRDAV